MRLLKTVFFCLALVSTPVHGATLERVHFLIPAGPGGGWDGTARGIGEALVKSGLVTDVSYENLSGGGGGRAIAKLIETADRQQHTLLVNSTPMVVRSLQKIFPHSFRDLVPVASVIADYSCFVVSRKAPWETWQQLVDDALKDPTSVKVAGGSVRGSTDHIIFARAIQLAGGNPRDVVYIPYDGGGKAMAGILTGETQVLSTGLSEAMDMAQAGEVRILAVTAPARLEEAPGIPTLRELGHDLEFANWRGFFAAPGLPASRYQEMMETLGKLVETPAFEAVRKRNRWSRLHQEGPEFYRFLERQEQEIGDLMRELGFLRPE
ncbi:MAG: tripartite tricarboxylate transporter substrate binding protein [Pseudomonadales bacterium]|nr:tripartite tricarboxylate transporter substrate binding protein [Pseudomonadales bacterium]